MWKYNFPNPVYSPCVELSIKDIKNKSAWTLETIKEYWQDFYNLHYFEQTMCYYLFKKNFYEEFDIGGKSQLAPIIAKKIGISITTPDLDTSLGTTTIWSTTP